MKKIVKIQSISDIITNSSSEVFIMEMSLAQGIENDYNTECITVDEITYEKYIHTSPVNYNLTLSLSPEENDTQKAFKEHKGCRVGYCFSIIFAK